MPSLIPPGPSFRWSGGTPRRGTPFTVPELESAWRKPSGSSPPIRSSFSSSVSWGSRSAVRASADSERSHHGCSPHRPAAGAAAGHHMAVRAAASAAAAARIRPLLTDGTLPARGSGVVARARRLLGRDRSARAPSPRRRDRAGSGCGRDGSDSVSGSTSSARRKRSDASFSCSSARTASSRPAASSRRARAMRSSASAARLLGAGVVELGLPAHLVRAAALVLQPPRAAAPHHEEKGGQRDQQQHGDHHDQEGAHFPVSIRPCTTETSKKTVGKSP